MELCLGTVQFGMDYGIRGQKQPTLEDALAMMDYATQNGVHSIDTAAAYGTAEDVVGAFLRKKTTPRYNLEVISKFPPNALDGKSPGQYYSILRQTLEKTLTKLQTDYLDGYLLHSARYVFDEEILVALAQLEKEGLARRTGVSVYEPDETKAGLASPYVTLLQFPYSIFDQRMDEQGVFALAEKSAVQIDIRSVFIQGLILMKPDEVPPFMAKAGPILQKLEELCTKYGYSRIQLALGFIKRQTIANRVVIGVDNMVQLQEDIGLFANGLPMIEMEEIAREFSELDADVVMPSLWHRDREA